MKARHHQSRNTVSAALWCNRCKRETQHAVSDRKIGHCLECGIEKPKTEYQKVEWPPTCPCSAFPFPHYHTLEQAARMRRAFAAGVHEFESWRPRGGSR